MVDLHTHTNYSDGDSTLEQLLKEAEDNCVTILSITDHDTVNAHKKLKEFDYSKIYTGKIIAGGEFNAIFNNAKIELLGYNFDIDIIDRWCMETYNKNSDYMDLNKEFELMISTCHKNGVKIDDLTYDLSMGWPIDVILPSIKKYDENKELFTDREWNDSNYFFRCCNCNTDFPLYIDFSNQMPNAKAVSDAIRKAGGKVFLAHLFLYPLRDHMAYLDTLVNENIIDGIEVYHSKFTKEESKILEEYAKKNNLLISGGTDYHGSKKPGREIGKGYNNINIDDSIVINWINGGIMKQIYNKLVRDNIPEIIKSNGENPIISILNDEKYKEELEKNCMKNILKR